MPSDPEIRPYRPGDESSIVAGWNAIFPAQDALAERDLDDWRWQFADNTLARTEVVVADHRGEIVGQYACVPQRAVDGGKPVTIGLIVDAFVLPHWRRAGPRPGLIIHLARMLHECWCGGTATLAPHGHGHSLLYGYPFPIWRIAQRYLGSQIVRDMDVLFAEVRNPGYVPVARPPGVEVHEITGAAVRAAGDELWERLRAEVRFGLLRDGAWLDWRYVRHPAKQYRVLVARDAVSATLRGLAVLGRGRYVVDDAAIVCDWLCPQADAVAEQALLAALQREARDHGAAVLLAVFPQHDPRFLRWQRSGFLVGPPAHFLVMNTFQHHVRYLRDAWFFTLGDSDLV